MSGGRVMETSLLFLEVEIILVLAVLFIVGLMVAFYVVFPYDKDLDK
jgi:Sec-independent protein secretion pathway component TatC